MIPKNAMNGWMFVNMLVSDDVSVEANVDELYDCRIDQVLFESAADARAALLQAPEIALWYEDYAYGELSLDCCAAKVYEFLPDKFLVTPKSEKSRSVYAILELRFREFVKW